MKTRANAESSQTPILEAIGLTKRYGSITTVSDVSLCVYPGEVVGLLGRNGAGKSTSFYMICGLYHADAGVIRLNGHDVTRWPMHRRCRCGLGYLPQENSLFGAMTVEQNLYGAMEFAGYSRRERRALCDELLERFELKDHRKRIVGYAGSGGLSGGERRRLEVARALVCRPKILMLDEPFAACDPDTIGKIQRAVREISADGVAVLINDHSIANTLKITKRAYVINYGKVLCSGTALDVLCNPEAIHYYFEEQAKDNAETIGKAHGLDPAEARRRVDLAYEEVYRRWSDACFDIDPPDANERKRRDDRQNHATQRPSTYEEPRTRPRLGLRRRESSWNPTESASYQDERRPLRTSSDKNARAQEAPRKSLSLKRRDTGESPRQTPSPREMEPEDNRYAEQTSKLLRRRPRR